MARRVEARSWCFPGLAHMDAGYSAMLAAADGNIYTALCTHNGKDDALIVRYEPATNTTCVVADIGAATGEKGRAIPQGKVHTRMAESADGCIWFATHPTYPAGPVPENAPSGHFMEFDPASGVSRSVARAPDREAIITAAFDPVRSVAIGLSNPSGRLLICDLSNSTLDDLGPVTNGGSPCRSIGMDHDGRAWFTREPGEIVSVDPVNKRVEVATARMPHPDLPGESGMGVWRTALWDNSRGVFHAVHARTSFLFTFDPEHDKTVPIGSMAAEPDRGDPRSTFASLAFAQSPDGRIFTIAARGVFDFFNSRPLRGAAHLVSYEPEAGRIVDHGPILVEDGRRLWGSQNAAVSRDGSTLYLLAAVEATNSDEAAPATRLAVEATTTDGVSVAYQLRIVGIDLGWL